MPNHCYHTYNIFFIIIQNFNKLKVFQNNFFLSQLFHSIEWNNNEYNTRVAIKVYVNMNELDEPSVFILIKNNMKKKNVFWSWIEFNWPVKVNSLKGRRTKLCCFYPTASFQPHTWFLLILPQIMTQKPYMMLNWLLFASQYHHDWKVDINPHCTCIWMA